MCTAVSERLRSSLNAADGTKQSGRSASQQPSPTRLMTPLGHSRRFDARPITSALPLPADIFRAGRHVSRVPNPDVADIGGAKKSHPKAASEFKPDDRRSGGHQCWL